MSGHIAVAPALSAVPALRPHAAMSVVAAGASRSVHFDDVDSAYEAFCAAERAGTSPDPDEFCTRYPAVRSSLWQLLCAHKFLQKNNHLLGEATPPWPAPGTSFLGFHLEQILGRGAFAYVYLANETALDRPVALKVSTGAVVEARTLGRLGTERHPHIVPVHTVATDGTTGLSALSMPYLGCATLCDALNLYAVASGPPRRAIDLLAASRDRAGLVLCHPAAVDRARREVSFAAAVGRLAGQLLDALAFIHGQGIVHCDLKPSNVLLTPDGDAMLLDFNLSADTRQSEPRIGGTLDYAAPEQLEQMADGPAAPVTVGPRSDLFSLGVILYELLTGTHPFGGIEQSLTPEERCQLLRERHRRGAPSLRDRHPEIDPSLARLIDQCLAADPAQRPTSAAAALNRLRSPTSRLLRAARSPVVALLGAALVHVAVLAAVFPLPGQGPSDLERGHRAFERGQYEQALKHYERAVEADDEDADACRARGLTHLKLARRDQSHFGEAAADLTHADILRSKAQPEADLSTDERRELARDKARIGYARQGQGEPVSAEFYYNEARRLGLKSAALCNNLGLLLRHNRLRQGEAEHYLDEALKLDPNLGTAYHNRALLRLNQAQAASKSETRLTHLLAGIEDAQRALKVGPVTGELHRDAARLYAVAARHDPKHIPMALRHLKLAAQFGADCQFRDSTWSAVRDAREFSRIANIASPAFPTSHAALLISPTAP